MKSRKYHISPSSGVSARLFRSLTGGASASYLALCAWPLEKQRDWLRITERVALSHFAPHSPPLVSLGAHRGFLGLPLRPFLDAVSCPPFSNLVLVYHTDPGLGHDGPAASHSPNPVHDRVRGHAMTVVCRRHTGGTGSHGLFPSHDRGHVLCPVHGRGRDPGHGHGHNLCPGLFPFPGRGRGGHDHGRGPCPPYPCPSLGLCHEGPCRALCLSHGEVLCACG
jgi:hypothetical protein